MVRGLDKVDQLFVLTMTAYNLTRMRTLEAIRPLGAICRERTSEFPANAREGQKKPFALCKTTRLSAAVRVCGAVFQQPARVC